MNTTPTPSPVLAPHPTPSRVAWARFIVAEAPARLSRAGVSRHPTPEDTPADRVERATLDGWRALLAEARRVLGAAGLDL